MHKSQLVNLLAEESNMTPQDAEKVIRAFFDTIEQGLIEGERTEIRGLGSFKVKSYPGYIGRNPKTGEAIKIPPKRIPSFKVGRELRAVVSLGRNPLLDDGPKDEAGRQ
ncbi:MAG: integration host factor subunit beta [Deltaproteobacteria bacterium]|jgi:integration host factor subunit beta|nr:integration host factor subunit beta [Deltaproteobacteria bacterium]